MKKRLLLLACMIACIFSLTACGNEQSKKTIKYDEAQIKEEVTYIVTSLSEVSYDDANKALEELTEGTSDYAIIKSWYDNCKELGKIESVDKIDITADRKSLTCKVNAKYEKRKADITVVIVEKVSEGEKYLEIESFAINPVYTTAEKMKKACLNTILGIGTVFIVLILISWLISLFKIINKVETAIKNKKEAKDVTPTQAVDNTIAQIVEKEDVSDDLELIAVITAAIAASEGNNVSPDDLVVRSIRRVKKSNWLRA